MSNNFSVVVPLPRPISPEDLVEETKKILLKKRIEQEMMENLNFQQRVAEHKRKHPCCIYPEICVVAEQLPKDAPIC